MRQVTPVAAGLVSKQQVMVMQMQQQQESCLTLLLRLLAVA
jgi:hypothetical protein